jgi:hypothetical protein
MILAQILKVAMSWEYVVDAPIFWPYIRPNDLESSLMCGLFLFWDEKVRAAAATHCQFSPARNAVSICAAMSVICCIYEFLVLLSFA